MKLILITFLLISTSLMADTLKGVQVQGNCQIKVIPDRGSVSFTAENQAKNQQDAVQKTNNQINSLKEKIQKLKLADLELKTTSYNVFPVREYEKDRYVNKGIKASMTIEITTSEIARLGEAMVEASKVGIENVGSMMSFLSLEKTQTEYLKCLDIASNDAQKKADQLAKKLGFKVGSVLNVIESPIMSPQPVPFPERGMMAKGMMMDAAAPAAVEPGTQNFSTNIQVTFDIK